MSCKKAGKQKKKEVIPLAGWIAGTYPCCAGSSGTLCAALLISQDWKLPSSEVDSFPRSACLLPFLLYLQRMLGVDGLQKTIQQSLLLCYMTLLIF